LMILVANTASWGRGFQYLPAGDPNAGNAVITSGSAGFSFMVAPFLKVESLGGLSVSGTGVSSTTADAAFVFDAEETPLGQIKYQSTEYRVSGALDGLRTSVFYTSPTSFGVGAPALHLAGGLRIEMPSGEMPYAALKGNLGGAQAGVANFKGGFVEITNIELVGGYVTGAISGANGVVAQDHVVLWFGGGCPGNPGDSCNPTHDVSVVDGLDLMSSAFNVATATKLDLTANNLIKKALGLTAFSDEVIDPAHPFELLVSNALTLTGAQANVQFQSPIGYLHLPAPAPVPEPGSMLLMCLGLIGVAAGVRRQSHQGRGLANQAH